MCAFGAVLGKITQKTALLPSLKQSNFNHSMDQNYSDKRAGEYREDVGWDWKDPQKIRSGGEL